MARIEPRAGRWQGSKARIGEHREKPKPIFTHCCLVDVMRSRRDSGSRIHLQTNANSNLFTYEYSNAD